MRVWPDEARADAGAGGMRSLLRSLPTSGLPVIALLSGRASTAARGGALLADVLTGGPHAARTDVLRLREASGTAPDYLRVVGAEAIARVTAVGRSCGSNCSASAASYSNRRGMY
jgi:hypothetical protein